LEGLGRGDLVVPGDAAVDIEDLAGLTILPMMKTAYFPLGNAGAPPAISPDVLRRTMQRCQVHGAYNTADVRQVCLSVKRWRDARRPYAGPSLACLKQARA